MTRVLVFAKAPREGHVKTRLARDIGPRNATELYMRVGKRVVGQLASHPLTIWYDPPHARAEMEAWLGDQDYRAQPGGDLGARLSFAFGEHFLAQTSPAIAVGMDAPDVDAALIERAFVELQQADVVLGPAEDGGYYLIGLSRMFQSLFEAVPWSTAEVFAATVQRCEDAGLRLRLLETLADMDTVADARNLGFWPP